MIRTAGMEKTNISTEGKPISVSTTVRLHWRKSHPAAAGKVENEILNELIARDFAAGKVEHRFVLKSGNIAEIRKSSGFYYVGAVTDDGIHLLTIQSGVKAVPEEIKKLRMTPDWRPKKKT